MITIQNVTKEYNLGEQVITPVRNVNLTIDKQNFVIIIGRSGTGKSTLLNLVAGLTRPTIGQIIIDGTNIETMSDKEISLLRSHKMGYVFQFPSLLPSLDILENVTLPTTFVQKYEKNQDYAHAVELLDTIGLSQRSHSYPRHLSAGEQKRAVIARALVNRPQILLADEPTSDLDEDTEREIIELLKKINDSGVTILMVTHSLQLIPHATHVYRMEDGQVLPCL